MKIKINKKPRCFKVGIHGETEIQDYGKININPNEMLSFVNPEGKEYDVVAKDWGFYATPSVNERLVNEGFKTALVKNSSKQYYIMIVDIKEMKKFNKYCMDDQQEVVEWLDERK